MKAATLIMSAVLLSAVSASSANANWFSNQKTNTMFNLGSVRNPTVAEIRAYRADNAYAAEVRRAKREFNQGTIAPRPDTGVRTE